MGSTLIEAIAQAFGLKESDAEQLLFWTHEVDRQLAIERFGYPKDNWMPGSLMERLKEREYLWRLWQMSQEEEEEGSQALRAALKSALAS